MTKKEQKLLKRIDRALASLSYWEGMDECSQYNKVWLNRKCSGYRSKLNKLKKMLAEERTGELFSGEELEQIFKPIAERDSKNLTNALSKTLRTK